MALPKFLQSCLASYDLSQMDTQRDKALIITDVLNKGDGQDLEWLCKTYSRSEIVRVVASPIRGMWFKEILTYWQKILDIKIPNLKREMAYINLDPLSNIDLYKKFFKI